MTGSGGSVASFSVWDYVVFAGIIVGASGIGLWQAIRSRKEKTSEEFLLGGRQMHAVPVAMSLTASFMSGITVIGTPAESYCYGTAFWLFALTYFIMSAITAELFVPFFYRLGMTSVYEYLEMRFSKSVRALATTIFVVQTIVYTGLVLYAPAVALNLITGMNLWGVLVLTGVVCIIYCTVGGLKAVIWTDAVQLVIMLAGFGAVIAKGAVIQGGLARIWKDAEDGGRLNAFDFDPDPLKRHTFWTILVGGTVLWLSLYSINQAQVQRYLACRSLAHAKMSLYLNYLGLLATVSLAMFSGLVMYSIYMHCDPLTNNYVGATDQLLPYLVMDILGAHPGVPGLFVAAAYSGTLSTVSSSINALVAVTVEDFIRPKWKNLTEQQLSWISMSLSVFFGAVCIGMSGVASLMGSVLQAALSIIGILGGPLLGLFFLGMLFRTSNSIGAVTGLLTGLALTMWVGIGAQIYPPTDKKTNILLFGVNCTNSTGDYNMTSPAPWTSAGTSEPLVRPPLADTWYSLSYLYFCPLGVLCTIAMGLLVSLSTGGYKQERLDSNLFVRKSDLTCFNFRSNGSKMLDMEHEHKDNLEKTQERSDSYHKFDTTEKHEDKDTKF